MPRVAYLFPGQGVQDPEASSAVALRAPELLELACEMVGENPIPRSNESTRFAQPAIVLTSLAAWRGQPRDVAVAFAGHSLGELSALAAARAINEEDAVRLAVRRGELMAQAAESGGGGSMLAVLRGTLEQASELAEEHGLDVANDNAPGQVVLAGPSVGVEAARRSAIKRGLRAIELDVAGAFHTEAMQPMLAAYARALAFTFVYRTRVPVLSGLTGRPFADVRRELVEGVVAPVRWRSVMAGLHEMGVDSYVDVGPGTVLANLVDRNLSEVRDVAAARA